MEKLQEKLNSISDNYGGATINLDLQDLSFIINSLNFSKEYDKSQLKELEGFPYEIHLKKQISSAENLIKQLQQSLNQYN
jgi:hypothetical protein